MEEELNITYLVLGGHVEVEKYKYLYFMSFLTVYVLIICSNSVIVYLIWKHQDLHEPMYIFIAALLLNSVFLSTNIYPKLLIDFLSETQVISHQACLVQYSLFYALGSTEFLLLAAMAYDRYVSICKPLHYPTIMRKRTVSLFLAVAWLLPACQQVGLSTLSANQKLCSFTLKVIFCNNSIYKLFCVASRAISVYGLFILSNVVVLPVIFIVFTYTRILIICYRSSGEVRRKAAQTCLPHLIVLINYFCLFIYDVITVRLQYEFPKPARLIMSLQLVLYNPLFNPLIYGVKMREMYKHLKTLFCQDKINQCYKYSDVQVMWKCDLFEPDYVKYLHNTYCRTLFSGDLLNMGLFLGVLIFPIVKANKQQQQGQRGRVRRVMGGGRGREP